MTRPDQIRDDIETTQRELSADVNALTEKVTPSRIVQRRVGRMRSAMTSAKDKVMGTAEDTPSAGHALGSVASRTGSLASDTAEQMRSTASSAVETVAAAPKSVRRGTEGNPLAAGLIAFGAGWLVASLVPVSEQEKAVVGQATDLAREHAQPVVEQVAREAKENLAEPVHQAAESIKSTAGEAVSAVSDEAQSAAGDVGDHARQAKENVQHRT
ncbi:DUF3618 domain-containing protein [Amycolatopsis sp. NPDC023774]|uniref:DUF3618 domain-containing protein n=1 Tax=Amycolatopsis sp. NPDC023774 TaxID=3155015 RepID=UPI0033DB0916